MKTTCGALIVALTLLVAMPARAAEYQSFPIGPNGWRAAVIVFLQKWRPDPANVSGGISSNNVVHVYLVPGQFTGIYSVLRVKHAPDHFSKGIKALMDGGSAKILGFSGEHVYLLTWTKPTS